MLAKGMGLVAAPFFLATVGFAAALAYWWDELPTLPYAALWALLVLGIIGIGFVMFFFRDPEREVGPGVVSPADGKVVTVETTGSRLHIAIFMNVDDVHVNRAPLECTVKGMKRTGKGFALAYSTETGTNVRLEWELGTPYGPVQLHQVTGWFARRIVPYVGEGASLRKGERLGLIRFGSRVEVWLPADRFKPSVDVGARVRAGTSTIAESVGGSR